METNIFRILGIQTHEDIISNALAYSFNNSPSFRDIFLESICEKDPKKYIKCEAHTRLSTATSGVPDIILSCFYSQSVDLIIIENKLKAEEGGDQTIRYSSTECIDSLIKNPKLNLNGKIVTQPSSFVFLTLFPDQKPTETEKFQVKTYFDLSKNIHKIIKWENPLVEQLIKDWNELLDNFYAHEPVNINDNITEKLTDTDGLDAGYLYFRSMLTRITLPSGLEREYFFRSSRQGRHFYGVRISKQEWHPEEMMEINGQWQLDCNKNFNIHFEPQYDVVNNMFNLFLHYEINPYDTERWVLDNIPPNQYEDYKEVREGFIRKLETENIPHLIIGGRSNQIAKATFNFQNERFGKAQEDIVNFINVVSNKIDSMLASL